MDITPACYRSSFGKKVVIIDCFEVFIERPFNLLGRASKWSSYKHHNSVKVLNPYGESYWGCSSIVHNIKGNSAHKFHHKKRSRTKTITYLPTVPDFPGLSCIYPSCPGVPELEPNVLDFSPLVTKLQVNKVHNSD